MKRKIFNQEQYLPGNELTFIRGGEDYFIRLIKLINEARQQLYFQVYIFDEDRTGKEVAEALKHAAQRGVEVFLVVDSFGSKELSPEFIADLKQSGIHFRLFSPLPKHFYAFRIGRRLHSKVVVADQAIALVGGINVADKYRGSAEEEPWLDFALGITGPVCAGLARISEQIYKEKYLGKLHPKRGKKLAYQAADGVWSRLALNDWFRRKNQIGAAYRAAFRKSQHSIIIVASYFMPGRGLRSALKRASRRGVQISILLPGESDVPMAKRATRFLYQWLFRHKITVYEWDKSILHGKLAVVDRNWVTVGSYNLNHLSQFSSIETNLEVLDSTFGATVHDYISKLLEASSSISVDDFQKSRGAFNQMLDWASYTLGRWTMLFLFFLVLRDHRFKGKE